MRKFGVLAFVLLFIACASINDDLQESLGVPDFFYTSSNIKCPIGQISFSYPKGHSDFKEVISFSISSEKCETLTNFSEIIGGIKETSDGAFYLLGKAVSKSSVTGEEFTIATTDRAQYQITKDSNVGWQLGFADFIEKTAVNICEKITNSKCFLMKSESLCWYDDENSNFLFKKQRCGELVRNKYNEDKILPFRNTKILLHDANSFSNTVHEQNIQKLLSQNDSEKPAVKFSDDDNNNFSSKEIRNKSLGSELTTFEDKSKKTLEIEDPSPSYVSSNRAPSKVTSNETKLFLSCEVVDKGRTKLEIYDNGYSAFDFGNTTLITKRNIFQRVPDKEKYPIYLDIENKSVSIEASSDLEDSYRNVSFSGKLITETESSFYIEAERSWGEKWEININRNTGTINIKPKGFVGILDAIERLDNDRPIRILEGYCEARPKRKF